MVSYVGIRTAGGNVVRRVERRGNATIRMGEMVGATAFDWGEGGDPDGAATLALAILADHLRDDLEADRFGLAYRDAVIMVLPRLTWTLEAGEVDQVVRRLRDGR
jgi:hypothetical protein